MRVTIKDALECNEWKTCTKCGEEKKEVFFSIGRGKRKAQCKECDKAYRESKKLDKVCDKAFRGFNNTEPKPSLLKRIAKWILS